LLLARRLLVGRSPRRGWDSRVLSKAEGHAVGPCTTVMMVESALRAQVHLYSRKEQWRPITQA
jgi:hypothetical protein